MVSADDASIEDLLMQASQGDREALDRLLAEHRPRLRQMVAIHLDRRVAPRLDASDVVQETLVEATRRLPEYVEKRPLPFHLWLRQLAWQRLTDVYRTHVRADRRAADREAPDLLPLSDESASSLARRLIASGSAPSAQLRRQEEQQRVRKALDRLAPNDRQVLVLVFLEQLSTADVATIVGMSQAGVRHRMRRALEQMAELLADQDSD